MTKKKLKDVVRAARKMAPYGHIPSAAIINLNLKENLSKSGSDYCLALGDETEAYAKKKKETGTSPKYFASASMWYERAAELGADEDSIIKRLERLDKACDSYTPSKRYGKHHQENEKVTIKRVRELSKGLIKELDGVKRVKKSLKELEKSY